MNTTHYTQVNISFESSLNHRQPNTRKKWETHLIRMHFPSVLLAQNYVRDIIMPFLYDEKKTMTLNPSWLPMMPKNYSAYSHVEFVANTPNGDYLIFLCYKTFEGTEKKHCIGTMYDRELELADFSTNFPQTFMNILKEL